MSGIREIKQEELDKVSGGYISDEGYGMFTGYVSNVAAYKGKADPLYFAKHYADGHVCWFRGNIESMYTELVGEEPVCVVYVLEMSQARIFGQLEEIKLAKTCKIYAKNWAAYTTKTD